MQATMSSKHSYNNIDWSHHAASERRAVGDGDPQSTLQTEDGNMMKLRPVERNVDVFSSHQEAGNKLHVSDITASAGSRLPNYNLTLNYP